MNWESILTSVIASAIVGFGSGWMGVRVKLALVEAKTDANAQETLRLRDKVHDHANMLHGLKGHVEMLEHRGRK